MKFVEQIMDKQGYEYAINRLAHEIVESNHGTKDLCIIGIARRGVNIANDLVAVIEKAYGKVLQGKLDITLYRDDLSKVNETPVLNGTEISCDLAGKTVVLVDDVLYTGETVRVAVDALYRIGKPAKTKLCVLIDRGHRTIPFVAEFVGAHIFTKANQVIKVKCQTLDGQNCTELHEI
ncbi:MAG: bifunctional pyr operon transcriptional regulator/uracil phosphoribosyltransferase PyrR [Firmicutes bacterium]|nr:bifunctional pyr operon transcriptional regulator/uracil phosphoribosyltransferase PyrR [Bacillota bacterium]